METVRTTAASKKRKRMGLYMEKSELQNKLQEICAAEGIRVPEISEDMVPAVHHLLQLLKSEQDARYSAEHSLAFITASMDALPNPIFIKNDQLQFVFFNQAYRDFFGFKGNENIGKRVQDLTYLPQEDRARYHAEDSALLQSLSVIQYDMPFQKADQTTVDTLYWSKGFQSAETGENGLIGEIVDITEEKELERRLKLKMSALNVLLREAKDASNTDPLTKLYNRNILREKIPLVIEETMGSGGAASILIIDIDNFKQVNDVYGHAVGDFLLSDLAQALRKTFRPQDIAVRYGGDEFVLVMPGANLNQALSGAERLKQTVKEECALPDQKKVTLSIGVTQWYENEEFKDVFSRADAALYEAKIQGKNQAVGH